MSLALMIFLWFHYFHNRPYSEQSLVIAKHRSLSVFVADREQEQSLDLHRDRMS